MKYRDRTKRVPVHFMTTQDMDAAAYASFDAAFARSRWNSIGPECACPPSTTPVCRWCPERDAPRAA